MTVKELRRELQTCEDELEVFVKDSYNFNDVTNEVLIECFVTIPYPNNSLKGVFLMTPYGKLRSEES